MNAPTHIYSIRVGTATFRIEERSVLEAYYQFQKITHGKMTVQSHQITQQDAPVGNHFLIF